MLQVRHSGKRLSLFVGLGCIVFFLLFLIPAFIVVIDAGEVGVYSLFGNVSDTPMQPGISFKNPLAKVIKMSTRTQDYTMTSIEEDSEYLTSTSGANDAIEARAKDGARIWLDITALYHLQSEKAPEIYKSLGINYVEKVVRPTIRSSIRGVAANYSVTEIYSTKRSEIQDKLFEQMKDDLGERGLELEDVLLRKVNLSQTLSDSIENKLATEQNVEKEKKEAERKRIEAKGQRDAQKTIAQGLTTNYLYYLYIKNLEKNESTIYVPIDPDNGMPLFKKID